MIVITFLLFNLPSTLCNVFVGRSNEQNAVHRPTSAGPITPSHPPTQYYPVRADMSGGPVDRRRLAVHSGEYIEHTCVYQLGDKRAHLLYGQTFPSRTRMGVCAVYGATVSTRRAVDDGHTFSARAQHACAIARRCVGARTHTHNAGITHRNATPVNSPKTEDDR
jgi:hypothetical protein